MVEGTLDPNFLKAFTRLSAQLPASAQAAAALAAKAASAAPAAAARAGSGSALADDGDGPMKPLHASKGTVANGKPKGTAGNRLDRLRYSMRQLHTREGCTGQWSASRGFKTLAPGHIVAARLSKRFMHSSQGVAAGGRLMGGRQISRALYQHDCLAALLGSAGWLQGPNAGRPV